MKVYIDTADWWVGYYRGPNHHYICPVPTVVVRIKRRIPALGECPVCLEPEAAHDPQCSFPSGSNTAKEER